ncbi:MAG: hypothetical protein ACON5A_04420 [Candidatus Comchoanobacterales bacterium]
MPAQETRYSKTDKVLYPDALRPTKAIDKASFAHQFQSEQQVRDYFSPFNFLLGLVITFSAMLVNIFALAGLYNTFAIGLFGTLLSLNFLKGKFWDQSVLNSALNAFKEKPDYKQSDRFANIMNPKNASHKDVNKKQGNKNDNGEDAAIHYNR